MRTNRLSNELGVYVRVVKAYLYAKGLSWFINSVGKNTFRNIENLKTKTLKWKHKNKIRFDWKLPSELLPIKWKSTKLTILMFNENLSTLPLYGLYNKMNQRLFWCAIANVLKWCWKCHFHREAYYFDVECNSMKYCMFIEAEAKTLNYESNAKHWKISFRQKHYTNSSFITYNNELKHGNNCYITGRF